MIIIIKHKRKRAGYTAHGGLAAIAAAIDTNVHTDATLSGRPSQNDRIKAVVEKGEKRAACAGF